MESILPSKKILGLAGVLIAILVVIFVIDSISQKNNPRNALVAQLSAEQKIDSDNDGLQDWEEHLWGTDPYDPDTDGDGTRDGDEVTNNRHPRVAVDDEIFDDYKTFIYESSGAEKIPATNSEELYDKVIPNIILAADKTISGEELTEADLDALIAPIVEEMDRDANYYTRDDIQVIENASQKEKEKYGGKLFQITAKFSEQELSLPDVLENVSIALENKDGSVLKELDTNIALYKSFTEEIANLRVPREYLYSHLALANSYMGISIAVRQIQKITDEPLVGLVGLDQYDKHQSTAVNTFYTLGREFTSLTTR